MTKEEILTELGKLYNGEGAERTHAMGFFERWLDRGDGVAVYENMALDSRNLGQLVFMSYGSEAAQIEEDEAPKIMPDMRMYSTPWAYRLKVSFRLAKGVANG